MSGKKGRSGGHNKKSVTWGDMTFNSLKEFAVYQGYTNKSSFWYYRTWGKQFRGHEIVVIN